MRKSVNRIVTICIIICICLLFYLGYDYYSKQQLSYKINQQLSALREGDLKTAYSYTSYDFRLITPYSKFQDFIKRYPVLRNNINANFFDKEVTGRRGTLEGSLKLVDGSSVPIRFELIKEGGEWKIYGIFISPYAEKPNVGQTSVDKNLPNFFEEKSTRYTINYPADWTYEKPEKGTILFTSKNETGDFSSVNIQSVLTKRSGGQYVDLDDFYKHFKDQAGQLKGFKILEEGTLTHDNMHGQYLILTYLYNDTQIKQLQYLFVRNDGSLFYAWAYTAPVATYDDNLLQAKEMFGSWRTY